MPDDVDPDDRVASYDTYDDRTMVSTSWTYEPLIIKTPAFAGGSEMTFSGANLGEAYDKLLAVNPNWNCTIVGGCPENGGLKKRDHAQVVGRPPPQYLEALLTGCRRYLRNAAALPQATMGT